MSDFQAFAINSWDSLFEVNAKGGELEEGQAPRKNPLRYLRYPCEAGPFTRQLEAVRRLAGPEAPYVVGIFVELARLVATNVRRWREGGIIRYYDAAHTPATFDQLADMLDLPPERLRAALDILTNPKVGLMRTVALRMPCTKQEEGFSGHSRKAGNSLPNEDENGYENGDVRRTKTDENENARDGMNATSVIFQRWEPIRNLLQKHYGADKAIENFIDHFNSEILNGMHPKHAMTDLSRIELHVKDSLGKEKPIRWFLSAIQRPRDQEGLAYVPPSKDKAA
ncbi:MAG: hypothetical protein M1376_11385 [Planctomycetes bacterium]|nr:hypothetical protein [Planctomycetota bacterium]